MTTGDHGISVLNAKTNTFIDTIPVRAWTQGLQVSPDGKTLYTVEIADESSAGGTLLSINTATRAVTRGAHIEDGSFDLLLSKDGKTLFMAQQVTVGVQGSIGSLVSINLATGSLSKLALPGQPFSLALHPTRNSLYIALLNTKLRELDLATMTLLGASLDVPGRSLGSLSTIPGSKYLYAGSERQMWVINAETNTLSAQIDFSSNNTLHEPFAANRAGQEVVYSVSSYGGVVMVFAPASLTQTPLSGGDVGALYTASVDNNSFPPATFTVTAGSLPGGLRLDAASGVISGYPVTAATSNFTVSASNGMGAPASKSYSITTRTVAPTITSLPPTAVTAGVDYSFTITASGAPKPTFSVWDGMLPAGLTLHPVTGVISGTSVDLTPRTVTIAARNGVGPDATTQYDFTVQGVAPVIETETLDAATAGVEYSFGFAASGIPAPTLGLSGTLPDGLDFDAMTGAVSGTTTEVGDHTFTVTASNEVGSVSKDYTLTVNGVEPTITSEAPAAATAGAAYSHRFTATGFPAPRFAVTDGTLPEGLTLDADSGELSGTTMELGAHNITVAASNTAGAVSMSYTLTVTGVAPVITSAAPKPITAGVAYEHVITGTGVPAPSFAITAGSLPAGLRLDEATGALRGTTLAVGDHAITVTATNAVGSVDAVYSLSVVAQRLEATPTPTIEGIKRAGYTLAAKTGPWAPAKVSLGYQWHRAGVAIAGATKSTYKLTSADVGKAVTVTVTGTKAGYTTVVKTSRAVTIEKPLTAAPTPTISGTVKAGQTLTAKAGTWGPKPVTLGYQWNRAGVAIKGATTATYKIAAADAGKAITVTVTGKKDWYAPIAKTSKSVTLAAKKLTAAPTPTISGTVKAGQTLTAKAGTWGPAPVALSYQWKRSGVAIPGATKASYKIAAADAGKAITVTVTGKKDWYAPIAKTSKSVTPK